ncbi:MAG: alpha/beta family hydrolase [bacterium]
MTIEFLTNGPDAGPHTLILAHGAGAPMDNPFMEFMATTLGEAGIRVLRFEFPYMAARRTDGKRRAPDREALLLATWRTAVGECGALAPFIGGKSMGGRMASMVADELGVAGLVCLGYPFHPPGNPTKTRTAHLEHLRTQTLIVQGSNDTFGTRADIAEYRLSSSIDIQWVEGGNHDLVAKGTGKLSGWKTVADSVATFISERATPGT